MTTRRRDGKAVPSWLIKNWDAAKSLAELQSRLDAIAAIAKDKGRILDFYQKELSTLARGTPARSVARLVGKWLPAKGGKERARK